MQYRHGDVGLVPVAVDVTAAKQRKDGILARGEVTGHAHRIAEADLAGAEIYDLADGRSVLRVTAEGGISIVHEEHAPIQVAPGDYEIRIAREYDEEEEFRRVSD